MNEHMFRNLGTSAEMINIPVLFHFHGAPFLKRNRRISATDSVLTRVCERLTAKSAQSLQQSASRQSQAPTHSSQPSAAYCSSLFFFFCCCVSANSRSCSGSDMSNILVTHHIYAHQPNAHGTNVTGQTVRGKQSTTRESPLRLREQLRDSSNNRMSCK